MASLAQTLHCLTGGTCSCACGNALLIPPRCPHVRPVSSRQRYLVLLTLLEASEWLQLIECPIATRCYLALRARTGSTPAHNTQTHKHIHQQPAGVSSQSASQVADSRQCIVLIFIKWWGSEGRSILSLRRAMCKPLLTSNCKVNGHFSIQIIILQGQFSILSAFSIEKSGGKLAFMLQFAYPSQLGAIG